ncbi:MAG: hypothetical protein ACM3TN_11760 [Alphaproteobacteria bacterium]
MAEKRLPEHFLKRLKQFFYQALLLVISGWIVFSLPRVLTFFARVVRDYWLLVESKDTYQIPVEIGSVLLFLLLFNYLGRNWKNRKIARVAWHSGFVDSFYGGTLLAQRKIRRLKRKQSFGENVLIMASTGVRSFVDPHGDLYRVLKDCRAAKIMLLNPNGEGALTRARSMLEPGVTTGCFKEQIKKSIDFLKELKEHGKNIRLKLYVDPPFLKLAILGDYVWMKHYHPAFDVDSMPEYLFQHDQNPRGLYTLFVQYFLKIWGSAEIPEYDFKCDELVYNDAAGREIKRKRAQLTDEFDTREDLPEGPYPRIFATH